MNRIVIRVQEVQSFVWQRKFKKDEYSKEEKKQLEAYRSWW